MNRTLYILISAAFGIFLSCICGAALRPPSPQPPWKVGDSWKVRTWKMKIDLTSLAAVPKKGPPVDITFEIRRVVSTSDFAIPYLGRGPLRARYGNPTLPPGGYQCFEIQAASSPGSSEHQEKFLLYFRRDTGNLIRILDNSGRKDGPAVNMLWDFSPDPNGPVTETGFTPRQIFFTFPDFTQDPNYVRERVIGPNQDDKEVIRQTITAHIVKSKDGTEREEYEVVMLTQRRGYEFKTVQKWRKGDPWWYEARQYENGKLKGNEAVLLRREERQP